MYANEVIPNKRDYPCRGHPGDPFPKTQVIVAMFIGLSHVLRTECFAEIW